MNLPPQNPLFMQQMPTMGPPPMMGPPGHRFHRNPGNLFNQATLGANFADDEALPDGGSAGAGQEHMQPEEEVLSSGALRVAAKVEYASLPRDAAHTVFGLVSLSSSTTQEQEANLSASPAPAAVTSSSITASGTAAAGEQPRVPMDVVCVLDVSG